MTNTADSQFARLLDELERWNRKVNLTAVRDREQMRVLHIADSLAARPLLEGRRILDVACGPGAFSVLFPPESYHGVDINKRYIAYAERHYRGSFRVMDARNLQFEDGSFDDALVFGLLHHLDDEDAKIELSEGGGIAVFHGCKSDRTRQRNSRSWSAGC